ILTQTKYGDSYNCVDFYEQPAFDHPLLKDRKHEFKMSSYDDKLNEKSYINPSDIWVNGKGCPPNTVPIKRITKEDLMRINMASELAYHNSVNENPCVQVAVLRTTTTNKYYGGGMSSAIWHPDVQSNQYSSSRVKYQNGPDSIAVGWVVNPSLYPDGQTHMFIYTITGNSHCYNTYCPGYIIMRPDIPPDVLLKSHSNPKESLYEHNVFVYKDAANGNWFLEVGPDSTMIGTWPQQIFTGLADSASYVDWGGEVYSPPDMAPPPMGSGYLPVRNFLYDCYARLVTIINENNQIDYDPPSCERYETTSNMYQLVDNGYDGGNKRVIFFGGTKV
ncbi:hypothetical protein LINPERPRIM_LOCUS7701, partial [Linum perenne]